MPLEYNVFPNFYQKYTWYPETEGPDHFIGRKHYFQNFWLNLCSLVGQGPERINKGFELLTKNL